MKKWIIIGFVFIIGLLAAACGNEKDEIDPIKRETLEKVNQLTAIRDEYYKIYESEMLKLMSEDLKTSSIRYMNDSKYDMLVIKAKSVSDSLKNLSDKVNCVKLSNELPLPLLYYQKNLIARINSTRIALSDFANTPYNNRRMLRNTISSDIDFSFKDAVLWMNEYEAKGYTDGIYYTQSEPDMFLTSYDVFGFQKGILGAALVSAEYNPLGGKFTEYRLTFELSNISENEVLEIIPVASIGVKGEKPEVMDYDLDYTFEKAFSGNVLYRTLIDNDDKLYPGQKARCCFTAKIPHTADEDLYVTIQTGIKKDKNTIELPLRWLLSNGYPVKLNMRM